MSQPEWRATAARILREAAYLLMIDGWDPALGVDVIRSPVNGRYYRPSTLTGAILRAYRIVRAKWVDMVRASEALRDLLGLKMPRDVNVWERAPGRDDDQVSRALLRAAWRLEHA